MKRPHTHIPAPGCLYIEADDPVPLIRKGIDPYCGKPRKDGSNFCDDHYRLCVVKGNPVPYGASRK